MSGIPVLPIILACFFFLPLNGQVGSGSIYGRIKDSASLEPITNVDVFIPFTSIGTLTDSNGEYSLNHIPAGTVRVSFRHISYRPEVQEFTINQYDSARFDVILKEAIIEIEEVTKTVNKVEWIYGLILFKEMVLGDPYESSCVLKNPKDLFFYRDGDIISGHARNPLKISNTYLGYDISYYLDDFRFDKNKNPVATYYNDEYFTFGGLAVYSDKGAERRVKKTKWIRNRQAEFQGSLNQFLRDVYQDSTQSRKFCLREISLDGQDSIFFWDKEQSEGRFIRYSRDEDFVLGDSVLVNGPDPDQKTLILPGPMLVLFNYLNTPVLSDDRVCLLEAEKGIIVFDSDGQCRTINGSLTWIFLDSKKLLRNMLPLDYDPSGK